MVKASPGIARQERTDLAGQGEARPGTTRQAWPGQAKHGMQRIVTLCLITAGEVRLGETWLSMAGRRTA